jgi:hypothetical protein
MLEQSTVSSSLGHRQDRSAIRPNTGLCGIFQHDQNEATDIGAQACVDEDVGFVEQFGDARRLAALPIVVCARFDDHIAFSDSLLSKVLLFDGKLTWRIQQRERCVSLLARRCTSTGGTVLHNHHDQARVFDQGHVRFHFELVSFIPPRRFEEYIPRVVVDHRCVDVIIDVAIVCFREH